MLLEIPRGDGGVVEYAESHAAAGAGMVPGRTDGAKGTVGLSPHNFITCGQGSSDRPESDIERFPAEEGMACGQLFGPTPDVFVDDRDILRPMNGLYPAQ